MPQVSHQHVISAMTLSQRVFRSIPEPFFQPGLKKIWNFQICSLFFLQGESWEKKGLKRQLYVKKQHLVNWKVFDDKTTACQCHYNQVKTEKVGRIMNDLWIDFLRKRCII